ncbi:MAG: carbohydrate ABC transporter permease [Clostridium sp.]|nr:carbohydrate ABC transporter permease [Clostridium sp.]
MKEKWKKLGQKSVSYYVTEVILWTVLLLLVIIYGIPFFWLVSRSLMTNQELYKVPTIWWPAEMQWDNFYRAVTAFPFWRYLRNTLIVVGFNILGAVLSNPLIAYGFAKIKWKGRNAVFIVVLMTMMLPFQVTMIPLFMLFKKFGWIGTFLPMIVTPFFGNPFFIFLMRQFLVQIPGELSEAAKLDGASEFQIYTRVVLPLMKTSITTVGIFAFLNSWNDFIGPLIFLSSDKLYTLSIGIQQIMSANDPRWTLIMAVGVMMTMPVLLIFFFMQKYFIAGISFGAVKG